MKKILNKIINNLYSIIISPIPYIIHILSVRLSLINLIILFVVMFFYSDFVVFIKHLTFYQDCLFYYSHFREQYTFNYHFIFDHPQSIFVLQIFLSFYIILFLLFFIIKGNYSIFLKQVYPKFYFLMEILYAIIIVIMIFYLIDVIYGMYYMKVYHLNSLQDYSKIFPYKVFSNYYPYIVYEWSLKERIEFFEFLKQIYNIPSKDALYSSLYDENGEFFSKEDIYYLISLDPREMHNYFSFLFELKCYEYEVMLEEIRIFNFQKFQDEQARIILQIYREEMARDIKVLENTIDYYKEREDTARGIGCIFLVLGILFFIGTHHEQILKILEAIADDIAYQRM